MMNIIKNLKGKKLLLAIAILALLPLALVGCACSNENYVNDGLSVDRHDANATDTDNIPEDPLDRAEWQVNDITAGIKFYENKVETLEKKENLCLRGKELLNEYREDIEFLEEELEELLTLRDILRKVYENDPKTKEFIHAMGNGITFFVKNGQLFCVDLNGESKLIYDPN